MLDGIADNTAWLRAYAAEQVLATRVISENVRATGRNVRLVKRELGAVLLFGGLQAVLAGWILLKGGQS